MKKVALFKNIEKPIASIIYEKLVKHFQDNKILIMNKEEDLTKDIDMLIVLGGDGTLLHIARQKKWLGVPVLGINCGNLGFLSEVETEELDNAISKITTGSYSIEKRMLLDVRVYRNKKEVYQSLAINEAALTKGTLSRLINIDVFVNNHWVDTYPSDGVILSTPTGSTAYSLSAGGPIVSPDTSAFIITPIAAHALYARPILISPSSIVKMQVRTTDYCYLSIDGQENVKFFKNDIVKLKKSKKELKLVRIKELDFFKLMRQKLRRTEVRGDKNC